MVKVETTSRSGTLTYGGDLRTASQAGASRDLTLVYQSAGQRAKEPISSGLALPVDVWDQSAMVAVQNPGLPVDGATPRPAPTIAGSNVLPVGIDVTGNPLEMMPSFFMKGRIPVTGVVSGMVVPSGMVPAKDQFGTAIGAGSFNDMTRELRPDITRKMAGQRRFIAFGADAGPIAPPGQLAPGLNRGFSGFLSGEPRKVVRMT